MNEALDLNYNAAQCIHTATHWGSTTYLNICKGTTTSLPWGEIDYAMTVVVLGAAAAVVLMFLSMAWVMVRDRF